MNINEPVLTSRLDNLTAHSPRFCAFAAEMAATGIGKQQILKWIDDWQSASSVSLALESFLASQFGVEQEVFQRRMKAYRECFFS
jgi:hypothetical protein